MSARGHSAFRATQGYTVPDLMAESRSLPLVVLNVVHEQLIELNLSNVFKDLFTMSDTLDEMAIAFMQSFLERKSKTLNRNQRGPLISWKWQISFQIEDL